MSARRAVFVFPFIALYFAAAGEENSSAPRAKPRTAATAANPARTEQKTVDVVSHIPRQTVQSTALASIGYSRRLHILEIEFRKGAVYRYLNVPYSVYRRLMSADSKTRYYDRHIRRRYRSQHVHPRTKLKRSH
jgi:KTSC domain